MSSEQNNSTVWAGSRIKFALTVTVDGTDLGFEDLHGDTYDVEFIARCGGRSISDGDAGLTIVGGENDEIYALVDTQMFPPGVLEIITKVAMPDSDFTDGRVEIDKQQVLYIKEV